MKLDYLVMCSKCEVRMHPDDYKKHKKHCNPYHVWITTTGGTSISTDSVPLCDGTTTSGTAYLAGVTPTNALPS